ncbi:hypothetical protein [Nocardioides convexus]|uniref:hypothetical protein n=1 Tax=Nocardioides convexus TaxID=2712224 RepID=UPI00241833A7|nr:hypothetical protein [Nocardioides convexus]
MTSLSADVGGVGVVTAHSGSTVGLLLPHDVPDFRARLAEAIGRCGQARGPRPGELVSRPSASASKDRDDDLRLPPRRHRSHPCGAATHRARGGGGVRQARVCRTCSR